MKKYSIISLVIAVLGLSACRNDNEQDLYNNTACDTSATTYSGFIVPLLANECYQCHNTANFNSSGGGVQLEGYDNLIDYVNDGSFIGSIKHEGGFAAMPQGSAKLDACSISRIETWINNGALNN